MSRPLNVLSLGKDGSLFSVAQSGQAGDARERHLFYAERLAQRFPGSQLRVVAFTRGSSGAWYEQASESLRLYGTRSASRASFFFDLRSRARAALSDGWAPDVITSQEPWEEGLVASRLARSLGVRDLPQLHFDILSPAWNAENVINPLKRVLARHVIRRASGVRVVSTPLKEQLVSRWRVDPEKIVVAPVGVNFRATARTPEECKARIAPECAGHPLVLFVGRLCAQKNLDLWLAVAARVLAQRPDARFALVGDGEDAAHLRARAQALGIGDAVMMLGKRGYAELPDLYGAADVFLLTSAYEGFGRVVLEAMIAGVPAVSTISRGPEDLIEHGVTGYLTPQGDEASLATHVQTLLSDRALARRLGEAGRASAAERFSLRALTDRVVDAWAGR